MIRAALWMAGTLLSFAGMAIGARELASELSTFQILFYRSLIGLILVSVLVGGSGWHQVRAQRWELHLARNSAHFLGQLGWFYGIAVLPLAEVFAIEFTTPLWTALLAAVLLSEPISRSRAAALVLGLIGIGIVLRPGIQAVSPGALAVLAGAFGYAGAHALTKKLTRESSPLSIVFYMTLLQLPMGLGPSLYHWATPSADSWPWLFVVAVTALSAHYCLARALSCADAMVVVPMDFLRLPLIALVGFVLYGEAVDRWLLAGAAVIVLGTLVNLYGERREADR